MQVPFQLKNTTKRAVRSLFCVVSVTEVVVDAQMLTNLYADVKKMFSLVDNLLHIVTKYLSYNLFF